MDPDCLTENFQKCKTPFGEYCQKSLFFDGNALPETPAGRFFRIFSSNYRITKIVIDFLASFVYNVLIAGPYAQGQQ